MPTTDTGYISRTSSEWYERLQALFNRYAADNNLPPPNWTRQEFVAAVGVVTATMLGEIDAIVPSLFDMYDENQASGELLRQLAYLASVTVNDGAKSRVTCTVGAWARGDVLLTVGNCTASDGVNDWDLAEDVTIPAGSTEDVVFESAEAGAITADPGTITQRVTGIPGWTSVTNAAAATIGTLADTDGVIRTAIAQGRGSGGSRSPHALAAAIERIPGVSAARVVFNPSGAAATVSTRSVPAYGFGVWVEPDTLTEAQMQTVLATIYALGAANAPRSLPTITDTDGVLGQIEGSNGQPFYEGFWFTTVVKYWVRVTLSAATAYEDGGNLADVTAPIRQIAAEYFAALVTGDALRQQDLIGRMVLIPGIARLSNLEFSTNGSSWSSADVVIDAGTRAVLNPDVAVPVVIVETA